MSSAASLPGARIKRGGFSRLWRTLQQLFHEVVAAIFAVLAFSWLNAAIRAWSRDAAYWLVAIAAVVGGLFLFFAFTSFQRSRKI
jgi:multisubunit Na+/H+ antiporter MnhB subunit